MIIHPVTFFTLFEKTFANWEYQRYMKLFDLPKLKFGKNF